jgi:copper oxidase (laccase) domain-containing protein
MVDSYGLRADSLVAAVGPCIGECCFEVGPEVSEQFGKPGAKHLDLPGENCRQLIEAGVPAANIDVAGLCTMCDATLFESFRRDREQSGRMLAAIGIFRD